jgi:hypothetical protein
VNIFSRSEFLKITAFFALGTMLDACNSNPKKTTQKEVEKVKQSLTFLDSDLIIITNQDERYDSLRAGFNKRINNTPKVIALCLTPLGVEQAVEYAILNKLKTTVKSGGHCLEGFSSASECIINVSLLQTIAINADNTATIGPGATVSQLYNTLLPLGKILPSGSCAGVAISGLSLGGGYGILSRRYGLTCDSLVAATVIDGQANKQLATDNSPLAWACRGGGNGNFGVVTSLTFQLQEAPKTIQTHLFKIKSASPERIQSVLESWFTITKNLNWNLFSGFVLNKRSIFIMLVNSNPEEYTAKDIFDQLSALTDKTIPGSFMPTARAVKSFYGIQTPLYFKNSCAGLYRSFDDIAVAIPQIIEKIHKSKGLIYAINTWGGNIQNTAFEARSSFAHRAYNYTSELQSYWELPTEENNRISEFDSTLQLFLANGNTAQYRNYPNVNFENWQQAYYGKNYERLKTIKQKYDPNNVFVHPQSI